MKKLLAIVVVLLAVGISFAEPPSAGWNFGSDTYAQHDGSLILNSLSDRYGVSTFDTLTQHLGTNDYIEENGVKNTLALDGYSQAYDYNPLSATGYGYNSVYNQPLPNVPLTKLTFMGLDGDPTKAQDVYVLTSEYNALSSQGQAASISALNTGLATTNTQVNANTSNISVLNAGLASTNSNLAVTNTNVATNATAIVNETVRATNAENTLGASLNQTNAQVNTNTSNINTLGTALNQTNAQVNTNTQNIGVLGNALTQTDAQVNTNTANIGNLYTGLNNETARAVGVETGLQNQVNATNSKVASLDNRVDQLEKVKVMADLNVRILDTKKYTVGFFDMYDGTNQRNFAFGARLTYKLGKSYEEKILQTQKKQLDSQASELLELRAMVHNLVVKNPSR